MNHRVLWIAGLVLILTAVPGMTAAASAETDPDPYLDFARHLFKQGDYYRTISEAKRFLYLHPDDARRVEAELLIARAYVEAGEPAQAREAFLPVLTQTSRPDLSAQAIMELGRCLERIDAPGEAVEYYRGVIGEPALPAGHETDLKNMARYRLGWIFLEAGRWSEARDAFDSVSVGHRLKPSAEILAARALEGGNQSYRSAKTAGVLSALLPGAGQLYVGRPTDAALAFGLNAAFLWGALEAYDDENWAVFALLGLMEVGWYGGNIYNAANGAHIKNREIKEEFLKDLKRDHAWRLGLAPRKEGAAISLSFNF